MRPATIAALLLCAPHIAFGQADLEAVVATDLGTFRFEFAPDKAPKHVEQFIRLARAGYYDGGAFFRAVARGIIQGGDPLLKDPKTPRDLWGTGGLNMLASEFSDLKHDRGVVSAVRIQTKPDSDGAQFFVCVGAQPAFDGQFSAFGRVTEGMDAVEKISQVPIDAQGMIEKPVHIIKVTIEPKKVEPYVNAPIEELRRTVTMKTTLGTMKLQMEPDWAPNQVRNFLKLVSTGWYNGTSFHRIVKGFVVQGGTENSRVGGAGHPADRWVHPIKGEFRADIKHVRGILSMARGDEPDSATTSFFIVLGASPHLDGKYSAFGRVIGGMEALDGFEKEELDGETPKRRLEIVEATVDPMGLEPR
jgi:peptidyl-prolyl cis-trans isomerase B (cyclophilin B)